MYSPYLLPNMEIYSIFNICKICTNFFDTAIEFCYL